MGQPIWHLSRNGKQWGPVSHEELLRQVAHGEVLPDDLLWKPGFANWTPASSIPGLLTPPGLPPNPSKKGSSPPLATDPRDFMGFSSLWRGRQSLWKAFWLYFVVGGILTQTLAIALAAVVQLVAEELNDGQPLGSVGAALLYAPLSFIAPAVYQGFAGIGVWRSASWRSLTGILAKTAVVLFLAFIFLAFGFLLYGVSTGTIPKS